MAGNLQFFEIATRKTIKVPRLASFDVATPLAFQFIPSTIFLCDGKYRHSEIQL